MDFIIFLEGLLIYDNWEKNIDYKSKHNRLIPKKMFGMIKN